MFKIETRDFEKGDFDNWELEFDYPSVYILENGKQAYIGETGDVIQRSRQHFSNSLKNKLKKYNFDKIHIINGELSEASSAMHFERLLIKLMRIDSVFAVINNNNGKKTSYKRATLFEKHFDKLWIKLEKKGLVKTKHFQTVLNSSNYKYTPYNILTPKQKQALTSIMNVIDSEEAQPQGKGYKPRPILIEGDAGTGKTVVATSLFYFLKTDSRYKDKEIAIVYPTTAMRDEISKVFNVTDGLDKEDVKAPIEVTKKFYDIVICDEAHKLRRAKNLGMYIRHMRDGNKRLDLGDNADELDWILSNSKCQILFCDKKQIASPSDIPHNDFMERLTEKTRGFRPVELKEQMRIMAGDSYVSYIHNVLRMKVKKPKAFKNYDLRLFTNFSDMLELLRQKDELFGMCRLCSGYAWKWKEGKGKNEVLTKIVIDSVEISWNTQTSGWLSNFKTKDEILMITTRYKNDIANREFGRQGTPPIGLG